MVAAGSRKRAASSEQSAAAQLRKQRTKVSLMAQQHNETLAEINEHLNKNPSVVPAVLQALRTGMFVPEAEDEEDTSLIATLSHNFVRWKDTPSWLVVRMFMRLGLSEQKIQDMIQIQKDIPDQLFLLTFALDPAAKVNSKMRNVVESTLMDRYTLAGKRLDTLGLKTKNFAAMDAGDFWKSFGAYRLLPETPQTDKAYAEVMHMPSRTKVNIESLGITPQWDFNNMHLEFGAGSACAIHPDEISTVLFHKLFNKTESVFEVCRKNEATVSDDSAKDHLSQALELGSEKDREMLNSAMRIAKSKRGRRGTT